MAIAIEVLEGKEGIVMCKIRGTGSDAGRKIRIIVRVPCASSITPVERKPTLPSDGSLSPGLEFIAANSTGKACWVSAEVSDPANNVLLNKRKKVLSL